MGPVIAEVSIDAPRERVYEAIADLANRPAFCDHFLEEFHLQRLESTGLGSAARFHVPARRFPIWMETVISELDPPHRIVESGRGSRADRMPVGTAWELVEGPAATTNVTLTFWADADNAVDAAKGKLGVDRWYRRQWKKALERLRDKLEQGEPLEPVRVAGASRI